MKSKPLVGITSDVVESSGRPAVQCTLTYARAVLEAGGVPIILPAIPALVADHLAACDAFVFTGGADPRTEQWGVPTHPSASPMHPLRQEYETALLGALGRDRPEAPVLGVCLGMQLMALEAGGRMNQYLPETLGEGASLHYDREHEIVPDDRHPPIAAALAGVRWAGAAHSRHRQAVLDAGRLGVVARAPDGVIEAVCDGARRFYLGVQWHPERTADPALGVALFERMVRAARG